MKHFTKECRKTTIIRRVVTTKEENGKVKEVLVAREFPVLINNGVPFNHNMLK